jgi:hypothetical protein
MSLLIDNLVIYKLNAEIKDGFNLLLNSLEHDKCSFFGRRYSLSLIGDAKKEHCWAVFGDLRAN